MSTYIKLELLRNEIISNPMSGFSYEDAIRFSTKMVIDYEKKGFLPNEFLELFANYDSERIIDWDTALYKYANYLYDLYKSNEMSIN